MVYHGKKWVKDANVLILDIGNKGRDAARYCNADLTIEGITENFEPIPWRLLEVGSGHGSSWRQSIVAKILCGFRASLWICYSFEQVTEAYIETATPETQDSLGRGPHILGFGQEHEAVVRVLGESVDMKAWKFKFLCHAWDKFEYTQPEEVFREET